VAPRFRCNERALALLVLAGLGAGSLAAEVSGTALPVPSSKPAAQEYSPVVRDTTATNVYWGDTHLHTRDSADAYSMGNETLTPDDAFRFARGAELRMHNGMRFRLRRPLDFLAVSDHSEYLGIYGRLRDPDSALLQWDVGRRWADYLRTGQNWPLVQEFLKAVETGAPEYRAPEAVRRSIWSDVARTADRHNEPGRFTAFSAYEWTSMLNGDNLHRVVLFRDGADKVARRLPFSAQDSTDPEALWQALEAYQEQTGGEVLAIGHNGNVSNGRMFAPTRLDGSAFTPAYVRMRARWEPLYEITQTKGDSETHPSLSPSDEFAAFERWDRGNLTLSSPKQSWMLRYEYVRQALLDGLGYHATLGVNPFRFGVIGSTDGHNSVSTAEEDNYFGKVVSNEPHAGRLEGRMGVGWMNAELGASGLAAVWAPENTREAIFAAFKRREVYGTTGSRIKLRFFGGFDFEATDVQRPDYAQIGYQKGVPMGAELLEAPAGKAPRFMVVAAKDPDEANLDRIQIIKGWLDEKGGTHEKIYDVALSDRRRVDPKTGKAPPVGSTVDVKNASYTNSIGDPELATVWADPDFDARQRAFYYVRVLEIPKPRWTAYDAAFFGEPMPANVPMTVQDRAYSSPIWYQP